MSTCTVWLNGGNQDRATMPFTLAADIGFFTADNGPDAPVNIRSWTFHLTTTRGVLTAACTTEQANHIIGRIDPTLVDRWCPTSFVPYPS